MKKEYDFSKGKRGTVASQGNKTRVTLWIDNDTVQAFRERAEVAGTGYQTEMNRALRQYLNQQKSGGEITLEDIRSVVHEELIALQA